MLSILSCQRLAKLEVLFKIGQIAVHVCAADDHDLGGLHAADVRHGLDTGAVVPLDGVAVDVQHHLECWDTASR